ncbi:hypothetical protein LJK87_17520 [Paenibacillus sp. P25]|nr:hypothetical protein LJK87_17520 [Paenibacillus sp. P25]
MKSYKERAKQKRRVERREQKRLDLMDQVVTFIYDRIVSGTLAPFIRKEFRFTEEKTALFLAKLSEHDIYNEMYRTGQPVDIELIRKWRPNDAGYRKIIQYTIERVRETLWFLGYGEKQLQKKYDAKLPPFPEWHELLNETFWGMQLSG